MFRLMQPSDLAAMKALWECKRGEPADFAEKAICRFAGTENAYVAEENGQLQALVLAVPISIRRRAVLWNLLPFGNQPAPGRAKTAGRRAAQLLVWTAARPIG